MTKRIRSAWALLGRIKPSLLVLQGKATIVRTDQHDWLEDLNRQVNDHLRVNDHPL